MENNDDIYFMLEALKEAKKAFHKDEVPIGAVIVVDNKIIARAYNKREMTENSLMHAEIIAITKASKFLKDWQLCNAKIYVTLEPCLMCAGALMEARIKEIIFGAYNLKGGALGSSINILEAKNLKHYPLVKSGILEYECSNIIKEFFNKKRNKKS